MNRGDAVARGCPSCSGRYWHASTCPVLASKLRLATVGLLAVTAVVILLQATTDLVAIRWPWLLATAVALGVLTIIVRAKARRGE